MAKMAIYDHMAIGPHATNMGKCDVPEKSYLCYQRMCCLYLTPPRHPSHPNQLINSLISLLAPAFKKGAFTTLDRSLRLKTNSNKKSESVCVEADLF